MHGNRRSASRRSTENHTERPWLRSVCRMQIHNLQVLRSAASLGCIHSTVRICWCAPCSNRSISPSGPTAANSPAFNSALHPSGVTAGMSPLPGGRYHSVIPYGMRVPVAARLVAYPVTYLWRVCCYTLYRYMDRASHTMRAVRIKRQISRKRIWNAGVAGWLWT